MNGFKFRPILIVCLSIWIGAPAWGRDEIPQTVDLTELIQPLEYPVMSAQVPLKSMQRRLQDVTYFVEAYCQNPSNNNPQTVAWACLWPQVVQEFDRVSTILAKNSPDRARMLQTLAAGLHPYDLLAHRNPELQNFDAYVGRYLISLRLLFDLWMPVRNLIAKQKFSTIYDQFLSNWLVAENPWDFAVKMQADSAFKQNLILIADDKELRELMKLQHDGPLPDATKSNFPIQPGHDFKFVDGHMDNILESILFGKGKYLFFARDYSDFENGVKQIKSYLANVERDTQQIPPKVLYSNNNLCNEMKELKEISSQFQLPWAKALNKTSESCDQLGDRVKVASHLESDEMLLRFNLFHMRTILQRFFLSNQDLDAQVIKQRQAERAFRFILKNIKDYQNRAVNTRNYRSEPQYIKNVDWPKTMMLYLEDILTDLGLR